VPARWAVYFSANSKHFQDGVNVDCGAPSGVFDIVAAAARPSIAISSPSATPTAAETVPTQIPRLAFFAACSGPM